jgi:hypothetical protein
MPSGAAKTVTLPRPTQGSFRRWCCSPNPTASTSAKSIQLHYEPFSSGSKGRNSKDGSRLAGNAEESHPTESRSATYRLQLGIE